ncbi:TrkH family potassium uptake protein [Halotia branconii]|uniref:TrkH family potassium uptake protein n=1 Tax=Halotia branconii CENA392 TaxID=1539056 RepID=A0AAJ6P8I0_9CYAN|nr:TrkH family potassium uptake protein [Halotia branconii]WGV24701.1 TrkH family potassium uptake protein [Halotia branconii CENA392]
MKIKIRPLSPHVRTILHYVGLLLHVPGVMALASLPVCIWFGEYYAILPFLETAIASLIPGQLFYRIFSESKVTRLRHSLLIAAISWGIIPLLGAIPFLAIAHTTLSTPTPQTVLEFQYFWNAAFEAFSGFTSTGLTVTLHENELPHSLQWWRSLTEWIGGVGMIVLVLSVLEPSKDADQLYKAEARQQRIALTVTATVRRIWWIYFIYTGLSILLLYIAGMPLWDAINHAFTGISTGGFSIRDQSLGSYSPVIRLAIIPVMIAGAISFPIHYQLIKQRRLSALWQDSQHRALWLLLGLGTLALFIENRWFSGAFLWLDSLFQWVSALGTCGFETVDLQTWSPSAKLLLTLAMIVGGASGSTVGGLKLKRLVSFYKGVLWRFQRLTLQHHQLMRYQLENKVLTETEANRIIETAAILAVLWLGAIALGVMILLHVAPEYDFIDVLFEAASALGSVGLSAGITSPDLHWLGKLTLILLMWMGRLEIVPVLVLFSSLVNLGRSL